MTTEEKKLWWVKPKQHLSENEGVVQPPVEEGDLTSINDLIEINYLANNTVLRSPVDIDSIIEEINKEAASSPLGPYKAEGESRDIEDLITEAERIYKESSKSFDQLSQRSKTSQNVTDYLLSSYASYETSSVASSFSESTNASVTPTDDVPAAAVNDQEVLSDVANNKSDTSVQNIGSKIDQLFEEGDKYYSDEKPGEQDNNGSHKLNYDFILEIEMLKVELQQTRGVLEQVEKEKKQLSSSELNKKLEICLENLKDSEEQKTHLQTQLAELSDVHKHLKTSYEQLLSKNQKLENSVVELNALVDKYKNQLLESKENENILKEREYQLKQLLEKEKLECKDLRLQSEKDSKMIQDLNRQIKEMERIIVRKHPDSISSLILPGKNTSEIDLTAKYTLRDRVKVLEEEIVNKDVQSSKIILDIQEKFLQMKAKYENHIQDLELHVSDLKTQLKQKHDSYDIYTQTESVQELPQKCTSTVSTQTTKLYTKISNKNATDIKLHKQECHCEHSRTELINETDIQNCIKSNNMANTKDLNNGMLEEQNGNIDFSGNTLLPSTPQNITSIKEFIKELQIVKIERDALFKECYQLKEDFHNLKDRRLNDLSLLQQAHEEEAQSYITNINLLREQIEIQQISISSLQTQICSLQNELAIATIESDSKNPSYINILSSKEANDETQNDVVMSFKKQIAYLEQRYEEREHRLQVIIQGLTQKTLGNINCEQCSKRQKQLIAYKTELEELLVTLHALQ